MRDSVKSTTGGGTRRAAQARATRRRIIDGARELFLRHGYAATTLDQIAGAAGVAVQTVYFHFGNKATVLKEVVDVLSVGDDEPIPMLDRPWVRQVREEPDGRRALAVWLSNSRVIFGRVAPIMKVVRDAAGADPEMAAQWETNQRQRFIAHRTLVEQLRDKQALRPELTVQEAADIVFTLVSHEVYFLLTVERGWTPDRWESWINETVADAVLR
ncbi:TetR/AcrR family transcriptional regulator [Planotetraspora phitsanulokensis]|uniref:TetR family transcriptional regulator n=1 Tax=Planotetraspora phitsanulokensis TaxID=575192 RepID=A0A8J3U1B9_9ACTN|nr:TetR/AcrR family transcriptional regulator [Planotetraspora phitsanulokensis]GII36445.1 TetR family transcriptional regulator [Planotetraspora phitsanulokensis]